MLKHKTPYRITYLPIRWLAITKNKKQKGESQNVSRTTTSLSYLAIHRNKRDRDCTQRLEKHGRIANATSSFYLQQKKLQNKHKKIIKKC